MLLRGDELICHLFMETGAASAACMLKMLLEETLGSAFILFDE